MKRRILKSANWIYGLIIALLGFSQGCSISGIGAKMYGPQPVEYGAPNAYFKISGRVTDKNDNPIKSIEIKVKNTSTQDQFKTDELGNYILEYSDFPRNIVEITYKDIDGEENGGEFEEHTETIEIKDSDYKEGSGNWYKGKVEKVINTKLKLK